MSPPPLSALRYRGSLYSSTAVFFGFLRVLPPVVVPPFISHRTGHTFYRSRVFFGGSFFLALEAVGSLPSSPSTGSLRRSPTLRLARLWPTGAVRLEFLLFGRAPAALSTKRVQARPSGLPHLDQASFFLLGLVCLANTATVMMACDSSDGSDSSHSVRRARAVRVSVASFRCQARHVLQLSRLELLLAAATEHFSSFSKAGPRPKIVITWRDRPAF